MTTTALPGITRIQLPLPSDTDFSLSNLPFGVFSPPPFAELQQPELSKKNKSLTDASVPRNHRICTAVGDYLLDIYILTLNNAFATILPGSTYSTHPLLQPTLNAFASLGNSASRAVRVWLRKLIQAGGLPSGSVPDSPRLWPANAIWRRNTPGLQMHLPFSIGSFTNFYGTRHHAATHGELFRGENTPLHKNYLHNPVSYQGLSSSIVISGTPITRPHGQLPRRANLAPRFGPTEKLDYEIELAAFIGVESERGVPVDVNRATEHIFGFVLVNDWSARDMEAWEAVPMGPSSGKNFATTISPWVVTTDALAPFSVKREPQVKEMYNVPEELSKKAVTLLPYLTEKREKTIYDFPIECHVNPPRDTDGNMDFEGPAAATSTKWLIWSFPQMLAQMTVSGAQLDCGNLVSSGGISGPGQRERGSLMERNGGAGGRKVNVGWGKETVWLEDGDEVVIRAGGRVPVGMKLLHKSKVRRDPDGVAEEVEGEQDGDRDALKGVAGHDEILDYVENEVQIVATHAVDDEARAEWEHNQRVQAVIPDNDVREKLDRGPTLEKQLVPVLEEAMGTSAREIAERVWGKQAVPLTSSAKRDGTVRLERQKGQVAGGDKDVDMHIEVKVEPDGRFEEAMMARGRAMVKGQTNIEGRKTTPLNAGVAGALAVWQVAGTMMTGKGQSEVGVDGTSSGAGREERGKDIDREQERHEEEQREKGKQKETQMQIQIEKEKKEMEREEREKTGRYKAAGNRVGFGECIGVVIPAIDWREVMEASRGPMRVGNERR